MELNPKKCKEMLIDFRKDRTVIPAIKINACVLERVSSYKLLGLWIDDDLKWKTSTESIVKKAAKRLHFLKILKGYNAPREDLKTCILYFGNQISPGIWGPNLAWEFARGTIQGHRANPKARDENNTVVLKRLSSLHFYTFDLRTIDFL